MILNLIVLTFEVLYYSLFMKFAKGDGKLWKYILCFALITIFFSIIGTDHIYSYLLLILMSTYGIKYIVKIKIGLYDMFVILNMLIFKILIEYIFVILLFNFLKLDIYIIIFLTYFFKIIILFLIKKQIVKYVINFKKIWYNNNFYIRYIFSIIMFIYSMISAITMIFY